MRNWMIMPAMALSLAFVVGCGSSGSEPALTPEQQAQADAEALAQAEKEAIPVPIPASSPFAKIKYGMSQGEVYSILGQPTSQGAYVTGKAWIPFYYGGDKHRIIARYKGEGYIIFSQNHSFTSSVSVQTIYYDANERGFE